MEMTEIFITAILVLEVLFRIVPTSTNWSGIQVVYDILNKLVPNKIRSRVESTK